MQRRNRYLDEFSKLSPLEDTDEQSAKCHQDGDHPETMKMSTPIEQQNASSSVIAYCRERFNTVVKETANCHVPNVHRTKVCCELLFQLSESLPRLSQVLKPITKEIISNIYHASLNESPPEPYFQLVNDLRQRLNQLQQDMTELELRRQKLESNEARRVQVLERSAKKWQHNLLVHVFLIWRNHVRVLARQRQTFDRMLQVWHHDPNLARNTFLTWKLDVLSRKRETIETQLDAAVQRHIETETQTNDARTKIQRGQQEIAHLRASIENLTEQREELEKSITQMEYQIAQSKDRDINATVNTIVGLVRTGLFALSNEVRDLRQLVVPDVTKLWIFDDTVPPLEKISDNDLLLLWVNYHLKSVPNRLIENFSADFADGFVLARLLTTVFSNDIDINLKQISNMHSNINRCSAIVSAVKQCQAMSEDVREVLKPSLIAYSLMPDLTAVFVARIFIERPSLSRCITDTDQVAESIDNALDALDHLNSDNEALDESVLNDVIGHVRQAYRSVAALQDGINHQRSIWDHVQWRLRRFCLNALIRRCRGQPISLIDRRNRRQYNQWTDVDEPFLVQYLTEHQLQPGDVEVQKKVLLHTILQIRHLFASNYTALQAIFSAYANSNSETGNSKISFIQVWILANNSDLLSASLTPTKLKELFDSVIDNKDDLVDIPKFIRLLLKIAVLTCGDLQIGLLQSCREIIENRLLKLARQPMHFGNPGYLSPMLLPGLHPFIPVLFKDFKSATISEDIASSSIALDDVERLHEACGWQSLLTLEDTNALATQIADKNRILMLPQFLCLVVAICEIRYPNPLEDLSDRLYRFLTVNMKLSPIK